MTITRRVVLAAFAAAAAPSFTHIAFAQGKGQGNDKGGEGGGKGKGKHHHKNGRQLLGDKIKSNGHHVVDKNGPHTVSLDVRDGKVAGMKVKHEKKGDVAVKKYKTSKKMAAAPVQGGFQTVGYMQVQQTYLGTTYIGYAYYDDWGDEQIYWFPYDVILDGDTGAVEYVPA